MDHGFPHLLSQIITPDNSCERASTWERDLRTRLLCVSAMHQSPPTTNHCGWEWKTRFTLPGVTVPAKKWGLLVKLYDWRVPESYTPKQLLLTTSPVLQLGQQMAKLSCALSLAAAWRVPSTSHAWSLVLFSHELTKGGRKSPRGLARLWPMWPDYW